MTNHIPTPEKMVCRHEPSDPVAAFAHICKHCHAPIEAVGCDVCEGTGIGYSTNIGHIRCCVCRGSGIDRWEAVP